MGFVSVAAIIFLPSIAAEGQERTADVQHMILLSAKYLLVRICLLNQF